MKLTFVCGSSISFFQTGPHICQNRRKIDLIVINSLERKVHSDPNCQIGSHMIGDNFLLFSLFPILTNENLLWEAI